MKAYIIMHPIPTTLFTDRNLTIETIEDIHSLTGDTIIFSINASPKEEEITYLVTPYPEGAYLDKDGLFTWTPMTKQYGNVSFIAMAITKHGSGRTTINVSVEFRNSPPEFDIPQSVALTSGVPFELNVTAIDPDGDEIIYQANAYPPNATFDKDTHIFRWIPGDWQYGEGTLVFTAWDGFNATQTKVYYTLYNPKMLEYQPPRTLDTLFKLTVYDNNIVPRPKSAYNVFSQDELDATLALVVDGDSIIVHPGIYKRIVVDKSINLIGYGNPTIDARGRSSGIVVSSGGATIAGFTITNASEAGIDIYSSRNKVFNNIITNNTYGITMKYPANSNSVFNNSILNNTIGISAMCSAEDPQFTNNLILNNKNGGIHVLGTRVIIGDNTVAFNGDNGIVVNSSHWSYIYGNTIDSNAVNGMLISGGAEDIIKNNTISNNGLNGLYLEKSLDPILRGDQITEYDESEYLNRIYNNAIYRNRRCGIFMKEVSAIVSGNVFSYNDYGIWMVKSASLFEENRASKNDIGFLVISSDSCVIRRNEATQNDYGVYIDDGEKNLVTTNNLSYNDNYGILFGSYTRDNEARENILSMNTLGEVSDKGSNLVDLFGT